MFIFAGVRVEAANNQYQQSRLEARLIELAMRTDATGIGVSAFLRTVASIKRHDIQQFGEMFHLELCQAYLSTIDGVTLWAARNGWAACHSAIEWAEMSHDAAKTSGLKIRRVRWGSRPGRHILLTHDQLGAISKAFLKLQDNAAVRHHKVERVPDGTIALHRLPAPAGSLTGGRTVAVRCPHHADRTPSLVMWRNADGESGGAQCMVCRRDDRPATWSVRYSHHTATIYQPKTQLQPKLLNGRSNKNPMATIKPSLGPVGGCVAGSHGGKHLSATLRGYDTVDGFRTARKVSGPAADPMRLLRWHEGRSSGPAAVERAEYLSFLVDDSFRPIQWIPTGLCSVSTMRPTAWSGRRPIHWQAARQGWVLFDLDNITGLDGLEENAAKAAATIANQNNECSGRVAVVQTGPVGLQVWVELKHQRHSPEKWHRLPAVVAWYQRLGERMLAAVRNMGAIGGHVDMASCAAGRFGRRPGWRVLAGACRLFRSRLLLAIDKVKKRVKVAHAAERNSKLIKFTDRQAGCTRSRSPASSRLEIPPIPHGAERGPRKYPGSVRLMVPKQDNPDSSLCLPLVKPSGLMRMKVLHRKPRSLAFLSLSHDRKAARKKDIIWRPLLLVNGHELSSFHRTDNPHRRRGTDDHGPSLSFISGMDQFKKLLPSLPSVGVRQSLFRRFNVQVKHNGMIYGSVVNLHRDEKTSASTSEENSSLSYGVENGTP